MEGLEKAIWEASKKVEEIPKKWGYMESDDYILALMDALKNMYQVDIHKRLVYEETEEAEQKIRRYVRDIITNIFPIFDEKFKMLDSARKKIRKTKMRESDIKAKKDLDALMAKYTALYDAFYALVAFRSLEHFALYMEMDFPEKDKIWKYNLNCFHGYWYYTNQAILDKKWHIIESQCPTGYGKSYKDIVTMAWIFGLEVDADILKVVGNPQLVGDFTTKLVKMMCAERYARVFPHYNIFSCDKNQMFSICQLGGGQQPGKLLINGSRKGTSLLIVNKDTPVDGGRFKYRFYDDITRSKDKLSLSAHEKDKGQYDSQWKKRKYDDVENFEFFSGTTYHVEDFLSHVKRIYGGDSAIQSSVNKYTRTNQNFKSVFVCVPKLDPDTDECTFPHKYSTEETKKDRDNDYRTFMAMDQQQPQPLEGCPFTYDEIKTYDIIPHVEGASDESCWAALDTARTGKNYISMPIFEKIGDFHYLKDCYFALVNNQKALPFIVSKIEKHHITKLNVEVNVDESFTTLLKNALRDQGLDFCEIIGTYSVKKKDDRIYDASESIKNNMVFPRYGLYNDGSHMGTFMKHFTSYSYLHVNEFDDAPDAVALYSNCFISKSNHIPKVKTFNMRQNR